VPIGIIQTAFFLLLLCIAPTGREELYELFLDTLSQQAYGATIPPDAEHVLFLKPLLSDERRLESISAGDFRDIESEERLDGKIYECTKVN
jgi:hypothetical protein